MKELLFVYGTLRAGISHPMARLLARHAIWLGRGTIQGTLYSLGRYPGVVVTAFAKGNVAGDLYLLRNPALLRRLDRHEGCAHDQPHPHEFRRARIRVQGDQGTQWAWAYLFDRPWRGQRRIASGDWLSRDPEP